MDELVDGVMRFRRDVFPRRRDAYRRLAQQGQSPGALVIACSDSRVAPEVITQSEPGDIFVCRNAGNVVPPFGAGPCAVAAAIEYAVVGLGVRDIVVCGHTDCGAMRALLHPGLVEDMPSVERWLGQCRCASGAVGQARAVSPLSEGLRDLAGDNVAAQLAHLRTHPSVAARMAAGELRLHGWLFDIEHGTVAVMDDVTGAFVPLRGDAPPAARRGGRVA